MDPDEWAKSQLLPGAPVRLGSMGCLVDVNPETSLMNMTILMGKHTGGGGPKMDGSPL